MKIGRAFEGATQMYSASFFTTRLGHAALLSIVAMLAMNVVALNARLDAASTSYAAVPTAVELA
jgi:hypothetical protein